MNAVSLEDVTFGYSNQEDILRNISFSTACSTFLGIIGPNGGGKSTLLKLLLGFYTPRKGRILVFGKPPNHYPSVIGYVPQHPTFDIKFPISLLDVVLQGRQKFRALYRAPCQHDYIKCESILDRLDLLHLRHKPFGSLSGGQKQRALIGRAIAAEPKILLLDEPTASVDGQSELTILNILSSMKSSTTILMVTHTLGTIINHVDAILSVQGTANMMKKEEVCEHFALGLYHYPLVETSMTHFRSSFIPFPPPSQQEFAGK